MYFDHLSFSVICMIKYLLTALVIIAVSVGIAAAVPPIIPTSERLIASMELNRSAGNMTGDDYIVALVFAYVNDSMNISLQYDDPYLFNYGYNSDLLPEYTKLFEEADAKFPEYNLVSPVIDSGIDSGIGYMISRTILGMMYDSSHTNGDTINYTMPLRGYIDRTINNIFRNDGLGPWDIGNDFNEARTKVNSRLKEEERQRAMQREEAAKRRANEQERMQYQLDLDAHYKILFENYTSNLSILLNQSELNSALNLTDEAILHLVSPQSNIMMINKGDIFMRMGMYEKAIEIYQNANTTFKYGNESNEHRNKVQKDFERDWHTIILYKMNLAKQKLNDEIFAKKHDLRNAPDVTRLLSNHNEREYSFDIENHTFVDGGYAVSINLSAVNKPIDPTNETDVNIKVSADTRAFVSLCVEMLGDLFADKRVAYVCIQNNQTYLDRFGNKNEVAFYRVCMDNQTASKIGSWSDFKDYVAADLGKLSNVASVVALHGE
jgi:hypothetical protein